MFILNFKFEFFYASQAKCAHAKFAKPTSQATQARHAFFACCAHSCAVFALALNLPHIFFAPAHHALSHTLLRHAHRIFFAPFVRLFCARDKSAMRFLCVFCFFYFKFRTGFEKDFWKLKFKVFWKLKFKVFWKLKI